MIGRLGLERRAQFRLRSNEDLYDPLTNARVALGIYRQQGLKAWSTYTSGAYRKYLGAAAGVGASASAAARGAASGATSAARSVASSLGLSSPPELGTVVKVLAVVLALKLALR